MNTVVMESLARLAVELNASENKGRSFEHVPDNPDSVLGWGPLTVNTDSH